MIQHKLLSKRSKCVFGVPSVEYLGNFISAQDVSTDPKMIDAVQRWSTPTTVKQLKGFLGLDDCYRKFIKGYGLISKPLTELLRKDNFHWIVSADQAFAELKKALTSSPVLALPNYSLPFIVETDARGTCIGVVLIQPNHPIAFISKGIVPRHVALSVYERELLALVFAVTK
ncbi:putative mitochondrial protein AtMg00860 [Nicotiana tabacum]|uniref:Mitochondrial protein AtMg00860 n=1 Tax=Nicotiana tabacum TaxID=4097 RepID=A0AC58SIK0_TOBAC